MLISELARRADLPVATVKYYLREGLVGPGVATSPTRAQYDDTHLRRLRLVRALAEVGGLRLATISEVLAAVDDDDRPTLELLGAVHEPLAPATPDPSPGWLDAVDRLLQALGWPVHPMASHRRVLAHALETCAGLGHELDDATLRAYAAAAMAVAEVDVEGVPVADRELAIETVVVGTVLREPVLLALRRLAQEAASGRRFGAAGAGC